MKSFKIINILKETNYTKRDFAKAVGVCRPTLNKCITQFELDKNCSSPKLMIVFSRFTYHDQLTRVIVDDEIEYMKNALAQINKLKESFCEQYDEELENKKYAESWPEDIENRKTINNSLIEHIDEIEYANQSRNYLEYVICKDCRSVGTLLQMGPNGKLKCKSCKIESEPSRYGIEEHINIIEKKNYDGHISRNETKSEDNSIPASQIERYGNNYEVDDIVDCTIIKKLNHGILVQFGKKKGTIKTGNLSESIKHMIKPIGKPIRAKITRMDRGKYNLKMTENE